MADEIVVTDAKPNKDWYKSRTMVWAVILVLVNTYIALDAVIGVLPDIPASVITLINLISGGGIMQGRKNADTKISGKIF